MALRFPCVLALGSLLATPVAAEESVDAYLEWRQGDVLIVDGQRLVVGSATRFKGEGLAFSPGSIPLGYEIRAKGERQKDGSIAARELDARPNGQAWLEADIKQVTDQAEAQYRKLGRFVEEDSNGRVENVGRLLESGPQVARARRIVDALVPPHIEARDVRVYVIENEEWNAFAMGNYSIYVFSGLLDDMDDDEVAIVLGHELVHASHEHTRRHAKKQQFVGLGAVGALFLGEGIGNDVARGATQLATQLAASALSSGYGRDYEDQADRVGLRYAYEGGFDVTKGPGLWQRFAKKYGQEGRALNFFFSDHSLAAARARNLQRELALNYPEGPRRGPRADTPAGRAPGGGGPGRAQQGADASVGGIGLAPPGTPREDASGSSASTRIEVGMTPTQVRSRLGAPSRELRYGERVKWVYPELAVVFEAGRVSEVQF